MGDCQRCGDCCKSLDFVEILGYDADSDAWRWEEFYSARGVHTERSGNRLKVRVPQRCQHLRSNYKGTIYSCAIYADRPDICRGWKCQATLRDKLDEGKL